MSGAEVIGIISGTIAIIDASLKLYDAVNDASGLPQSFRDVAARLPLVQDTLETARAGVDEAQQDESASHAALARVLESCRDKAEALNKVLQAVMPAAGASRMKRYLKALKTIPNADKVENLMDGILGDLQVLTGNHAVHAARRTQMQRLMAQLTADRQPPGRASPSLSLHNAGSGVQLFHSGHGNQNLASGRGVQINGSSTGPFYFDRTE